MIGVEPEAADDAAQSLRTGTLQTLAVGSRQPLPRA